MRKRSLLLKVEHHFCQVESFSANQDVPRDNALKGTLQKRSLHNIKDRISAQEVKFIDLDELEASSPSKRQGYDGELYHA